jgi:membrane-associated protease RseP (regulator of RpoE activity)
VLFVTLLPVAALGLAVHYLWPGSAQVATTKNPDSPAVVGPTEDQTPEIHGKVLDDDGKVVRFASVRVIAPAPPYEVIRETKSDLTGSFSFAHLVPRRVRVEADHDPEGFATGEEVDVAQGQSDEFTLVLSPTSGVRGTVVDDRDRPVAGATLSVTGVPWQLASATTDKVGAFRLIVVPDQASGLIAVAPGFKASSVALAQRVPRTELVVRIKLGAAAPVAGDVRGVDGDPVRARVVACSGRPNEVATTSGDDGTFELPPSTIGCEAVAHMVGFAPSEAATIVEGTRVSLRMRANGGIEGTVVDDRGEGVPSYSLGIESYVQASSGSAVAAWLQPKPDRGPRTFADVRGTFRWDNLPPGSYVLTASVKGRPPARSDSVQVASAAFTKGVRIVVAVGGSVVGHVYDDHHSALSDVDIALEAVSSIAESSASAKSDATGSYRLDGAPAGPFTLRARKNGYRTRLFSGLRVASGGNITQDMTLAGTDGGADVELGGIGANLASSREGVIVAGVNPGDPAARAGIQAGDRIVTVDGESAEGMSLQDVIQRLRGEPGTNVGVSVERFGSGQVIDVVVLRAAIVR